MTKQERTFVSFVKAECKKHDVKCSLQKKDHIKLGGPSDFETCSGYFDGESKELACAVEVRAGWLGVLAHEYCHLTQWAEKDDTWVRAEKSESYSKVSDWLSGKPVRNIRHHLGLCRDLELNNEKRTVKIIKQFGLPINIEEYIQKANAYVQFYNHMYYTRKWCNPQNSPYRVPKLWKNMSPKFNMKYKVMSSQVKLLFDEVYLSI
jgi:hypothetical protein